MNFRTISVCALAAIALTACQSSNNKIDREVAAQVQGGVNSYLWRATLDTLAEMPVKSADPLGGLIIYDWKSFTEAPDERIKSTVYILDTRLRADGISVSVFRQIRENGEWVDADVDPATRVQLENAILQRARRLKASDVS
ncbi:MAG: DUF3576 domain-containing protein [Hyphomonadaceae bacterium]